MFEKLKTENLSLNKSLKKEGVSLSDIKVRVTSTRKYGETDVYRWTDALYKGKSISGYTVDPRHPHLTKRELATQKLLETVVAKKALLSFLHGGIAA